jgi:HAD superfamily hydrolase (TIGR01662 family)
MHVLQPPAAPLRAVFFDLGNTLLYFAGAWPQVLQRADAQLFAHLRTAGFALDEAQFLSEFRTRLNNYYIQREAEFVEHTTAYVLRNLLHDLGYPNVAEDELRPALRQLYAASQAHWTREEDTIPMLQQLRHSGYALGLISNAGDDEDVQTLVDKAELRPYFDLVLSSAAYGLRKPNPRIFAMAMEQIGAEPARSAMVGDTLGADILGANHAGMYSIWLTRRADTPANRDHQDTIQPSATISSLSELPALLASFSHAA